MEEVVVVWEHWMEAQLGNAAFDSRAYLIHLKRFVISQVQQRPVDASGLPRERRGVVGGPVFGAHIALIIHRMSPMLHFSEAIASHSVNGCSLRAVVTK